ncbi:elongation factor G [Limnochorda sp.]|uniref:elongation factor G n=1 Tax=Limnochorda sp. TaxID=1940279 RepID=UPI0017CA9BAC|nr:elongation factor G [Bacillota bacterium]MBO2518862.1 elongation factor G [Bacillota bacterium]NMA71397.1 elongation factor G [Bacillota bacterium]
MSQGTPERIRNVALISHQGAGKTTLAEALLFKAGVIKRQGSVDEGNTVSDYDPEEQRRRLSLNATVLPVPWESYKINLLDTPGYFDFVGDVLSALRVVEGAVVLVEAAAGVEVGTEKVWQYAEERKLPRICFVSKMDRENADFSKCLSELRARFGNRVAPIQVPVGQAESFRGVVDILEGKAYLDGSDTAADVPAEVEALVTEAREALEEAVAATDDDLTAKYLEEGSLSAEELRQGLAGAVKSGEVVPVLCGSAAKGIGLAQLLQAIGTLLPSPLEAEPQPTVAEGGEPVAPGDGPLAAYVFKTMADPYVGRLTLFRVYRGTINSDSTVHNSVRGKDERIGQIFVLRGKEQQAVSSLGPGDIGAVAKLQHTQTGDTLCAANAVVQLQPVQYPAPKLSLAAHAGERGDEDKIFSGLARLVEEDPTLAVERDPVTGETLVRGLGEMQLDVVVSRLKEKFGVTMELKTPKVPYQETIRSKVQAEGKHKKQTGGRGQYGHVFLELEPLPPGGGFEFVDKIFGGAVPKQYIPAVEKGIRETMAEGVLAGYPVVDVRATLYDGSFHPVDSSEMAFKIAASMAFKKAFEQANPVLLEPVMRVKVTVPESYMGDCIADLNKKRGKILGMNPDGDLQVIEALVPMAEMFHYATDLRSMTQGRGDFEMTFDHYEEVPAELAQKVIEEASNQAS